MGIRVNLDVMMAKRKMSSGELAEKIDITQANLSILKTGRPRRSAFPPWSASARSFPASPEIFLNMWRKKYESGSESNYESRSGIRHRL